MPHHENAGCHTQPCWVRPKSLSAGGHEFQRRVAASRPKALARAVAPMKSSPRQAALDAATPPWPQRSQEPGTWPTRLSVLSLVRGNTLKRRLGVAPDRVPHFASPATIGGGLPRSASLARHDRPGWRMLWQGASAKPAPAKAGEAISSRSSQDLQNVVLVPVGVR